jgi:predicted Zn-dependent peptidase
MKKSWQHTRYKFLGELNIDRFDFPNGLRLFAVENRIAPVFSYQTWFNVGSRDEVAGKSGLAHLFEHMMFKGTKKNPQGVFDRTMESSGARDLNAFTGTDYTAYVASLPTEALETVMKMESDRMVGLALTKEQFESEREVVHNERKQVMENNPEGKMYEELQKLAYRTHPYGRPVIGFAEDLDSMTTKDCEEFYRTYYAPNGAVICVVGALKPEKVAAMVDKYYGKIPAQPRPSGAVASEPKQEEERVSVLSLAVQVEKAYFGYKVPDAKHEDQVALYVLSYILSSGRSSRLYRALVDSGLCIDQGASLNGSKDPSLFYLSFTCQAGKKSEDALSAMDRVIKEISEKGVSEDELSRVKNKLRTEIHLGLVTNQALCRFIGQHEIVLGDVRAGVDEIEKIQAVTAAQVKEVAARYLRKNNRSVVIGKPE